MRILKTAFAAVMRLVASMGVVQGGWFKTDVTPVQLRCEYMESPLGIDVLRPRVNWKLKTAKQEIQH